MLDPHDPRVEMATLGRMVEDFLNGPIGSHLLERAKRQSELAIEQLKVAHAENPTMIRDLQAQIQVADSIVRWLGQTIHEGHMALANLQEDSDGG